MARFVPNIGVDEPVVLAPNVQWGDVWAREHPDLFFEPKRKPIVLTGDSFVRWCMGKRGRTVYVLGDQHQYGMAVTNTMLVMTQAGGFKFLFERLGQLPTDRTAEAINLDDATKELRKTVTYCLRCMTCPAEWAFEKEDDRIEWRDRHTFQLGHMAYESWTEKR